MEWTRADSGDLKRLEIAKIIFRNMPGLIDRVFHPTQAQLIKEPALVLKQGGFSGGERVLVKLAMDIWGDYGKLQVMDLYKLGPDNFRAAMEGILEWRKSL